MSGFIYAIECAGRIKIGFSTDPSKRLVQIATDWPFPPTLLGFWDGTMEEERLAHLRLKAHRVHGEWFLATDEVRAFVDKHVQFQPEIIAEDVMIDLCGHRVPRRAKTLIASKAGITSQAVCLWRKVPAHHVRLVESITGISRHRLRPDIFGEQPAAPSVEAAA
ncbi:GIY-YIG nuclease family protein [Acuticoccus sp. M5D2P5]|uniref:GIY-YIG nuclease family protein n=1 Tax=Acuticoccus kalidii TaxID=2910977 RepID=UPI001F2A7066|nr:GIY-YIG nuclease family protein [Acuticoccus kalidii]MCF3935051.1 GIY-YIG nuclease family protein [Acuticoccus kalidii]